MSDNLDASGTGANSGHRDFTKEMEEAAFGAIFGESAPARMESQSISDTNLRAAVSQLAQAMYMIKAHPSMEQTFSPEIMGKLQGDVTVTAHEAIGARGEQSSQLREFITIAAVNDAFEAMKAVSQQIPSPELKLYEAPLVNPSYRKPLDWSMIKPMPMDVVTDEITGQRTWVPKDKRSLAQMKADIEGTGTPHNLFNVLGDARRSAEEVEGVDLGRPETTRFIERYATARYMKAMLPDSVDEESYVKNAARALALSIDPNPAASAEGGVSRQADLLMEKITAAMDETIKKATGKSPAAAASVAG